MKNYNIDCIEITWVKNPMWVANPHVAITLDGVTSYGRASGCDSEKKGTAAVVAALMKNINNPIPDVNNLSDTSFHDVKHAFELATGRKVIHAINKDYYDLWIIEQKGDKEQ